MSRYFWPSSASLHSSPSDFVKNRNINNIEEAPLRQMGNGSSLYVLRLWGAYGCGE